MSTLLTVASLICAAALSLNCAAQAPPDTSTLAEAVTGGKLLFSLRPRLELVDQDGKDERARAFTLRTLLGWQTKPWHGLAVTAQAIDVSRIGSKRYNDEPASSASARFPTVATTAIGLLDAADTALYIIKSRGKATQTKELPPSARPSARKAA